MELNRDAIIKALECCQYKLVCNECPYFNEWELCDNIRINAAKLIKELTQAHEMLGESYNHLEKTKDELLAERARLTEDNARLSKDLTEAEELNCDLENRIDERKEYCSRCHVAHQAQIYITIADTVREMQARLCEGRVSNDPVVIAVNQVAKDMLEGNE